MRWDVFKSWSQRVFCLVYLAFPVFSPERWKIILSLNPLTFYSDRGFGSLWHWKVFVGKFFSRLEETKDIAPISGNLKISHLRSYLTWIHMKVGHGVVAGTTSSAYASGPWLGLPDRLYNIISVNFSNPFWTCLLSPGVTLVDSPGFNSSISDMEELVWLLADLQQVG